MRVDNISFNAWIILSMVCHIKWWLSGLVNGVSHWVSFVPKWKKSSYIMRVDHISFNILMHEQFCQWCVILKGRLVYGVSQWVFFVPIWKKSNFLCSQMKKKSPKMEKSLPYIMRVDFISFNNLIHEQLCQWCVILKGHINWICALSYLMNFFVKFIIIPIVVILTKLRRSK